MSLTECQRTGTFGLCSPSPSKKAVNFLIEDLDNNEDKAISTLKKPKKIEQCLPVNFFHPPGEYNKMLIRCLSPEIDSFVERRMGIVRNMEFVNEPLFEKEREKKSERIAKYTEQMKKQGEKRTKSSAGQSCTCCCCDDFCWECANESKCQEVASLKEEPIKKESFLIDVQAIKRGEKSQKRAKKVSNTLTVEIPNNIKESHFCCQKRGRSAVGIERLVTSSLLKEIEIKRERELEKLEGKERKKMKQLFNDSVRELNRPSSVPKPPVPKVNNPTKKELREAYWKSVKDLVSFELKKDKLEGSRLKKDEEEGSPKREFRMSAEQMHSNRILNGHEAMRIQKIGKAQKMKLEKLRAKKLMALADEQAAIIQKNPKKKFRPSKQTLENAFKLQTQE